MVSRQEALFGTSEITHVRMMDPIQYPHFANKLGEDAYRRIVGCDFSKIFGNKGLKIYQIFWSSGEFTGKTINAGIKKPAELYALPA